MDLSLLLLAVLAPAAPPSTSPITVTGHAWAPFISPMGEPFRAHTPADDTLADWFYQADRNRDGVISADEMEADAERFFRKLDTDHDGEIGPDELAQYEDEVAPEIQVMSKTRRVAGQAAPAPVQADLDDDHPGGQRRARRDEDFSSLGIGGALQGAARYSLLNMPEPVAAADTDFNRSITLQEFKEAALARFQLLDRTRHGGLTLAELEALPHAPSTTAHRAKLKEDAPDNRLGNPLPTGP